MASQDARKSLPAEASRSHGCIPCMAPNGDSPVDLEVHEVAFNFERKGGRKGERERYRARQVTVR